MDGSGSTTKARKATWFGLKVESSNTAGLLVFVERIIQGSQAEYPVPRVDRVSDSRPLSGFRRQSLSEILRLLSPFSKLSIPISIQRNLGSCPISRGAKKARVRASLVVDPQESVTRRLARCNLQLASVSFGGADQLQQKFDCGFRRAWGKI
jgi:hypothetical protein